MKKISLSIVLLMMTTSLMFAASKNKTTFKEDIENSKEVKVYFNVTEIVDREHERKIQQANPKGQTDIRTVMPKEFTSNEVKNNVITTLNTEMQVSAFKLGDVSELGKSDDKQTQFLDLTKLPDGIVAIVQVEGTYVRFLEKMADGFSASNRLEIKSNLFFYEIKGGVAKKIKVNMGMGANLGTVKTETIKTSKLESLEYMETNFPALPLLENYTKTMKEYTGDFAKRMLKKHDKAIAKRK